MQIFLDSFQSHANVGVYTCIRESDIPIVNVTMKELEMLSALRKSEIVRETLVIVAKVVLDGIRAISQTKDEVAMAEMRIILHHVPQDRSVADWHQGLRYILSVLPQPHAETAAEKHDFH